MQFSRYDEKSDFSEVMSRRDMAGMVRHGVSYWLIDIPTGRGITVGIRALCSEKTIG
jgi:hypothetical protein